MNPAVTLSAVAGWIFKRATISELLAPIAVVFWLVVWVLFWLEEGAGAFVFA